MLNRVCKNQCLPSTPPQIWLLLWSSVCFNVQLQCKKMAGEENHSYCSWKQYDGFLEVLHFLRHTIISGRLSRGEACGCRIWGEVLKARALLIEQHPLLCTFKESGLNFLPHVLQLQGYQATFLYITYDQYSVLALFQITLHNQRRLPIAQVKQLSAQCSG